MIKQKLDQLLEWFGFTSDFEKLIVYCMLLTILTFASLSIVLNVAKLFVEKPCEEFEYVYELPIRCIDFYFKDK